MGRAVAQMPAVVSVTVVLVTLQKRITTLIKAFMYNFSLNTQNNFRMTKHTHTHIHRFFANTQVFTVYWQRRYCLCQNFYKYTNRCLF